MTVYANNPLDTSTPNRQKISNTGSTTGEGYGTRGLDYAWDQLQNNEGYGGPNPYAGGYNEMQQAQADTLGGLQGTYGGPNGRWNDAYGVNEGVAGMEADAYNIGDRSGGPDPGYMNPYRDTMKGYLAEDYKGALQEMQNQVGFGAAGNNAFGGARHGVAEGVGGAKAQSDYLRQATGIDADAYDKGMGWQYEDQNLQAKLAMQANQDKLGFGNLNLGAANQMGDISQQLNLASNQGIVGDRDANRKMMEKSWLQQNWQDQQGRGDQLYRDYMSGVQGTPWQQQTVTRGQGGPSNLDKTMGYIGTAAGAYMAYKGSSLGGGGSCIPKGTTIDMADGSKVPIEKIEAGDLVIGMDGKEVEVQQVHQYKQTPGTKFVTITFDNGSKVNCSHDHMINNKRARDYTYHDKIGSREVTRIIFYMGVERSYDIITTTGGYRIEGIPVNTMIPEMAEKSLASVNKLMTKAA